MKDNLRIFGKWLGHNIAWLTICELTGMSCYLYGTLKEVRAGNDTYFADKIEKGEKINWNGIEYRKVGK